MKPIGCLSVSHLFMRARAATGLTVVTNQHKGCDHHLGVLKLGKSNCVLNSFWQPELICYLSVCDDCCCIRAFDSTIARQVGMHCTTVTLAKLQKRLLLRAPRCARQSKLYLPQVLRQ